MSILEALFCLWPFRAWSKSTFETVHSKQGDSKAEMRHSAQYTELLKVSC